MKRRRAEDHTREPAEADSITQNADRSARRKSTRRLIERTIAEAPSDHESSEGDELAQHIWDDEDQQELSENNEDEEAEEPKTPSKTRRGRPKGSKNRVQSPPSQHLPPHERYFWDNRPGASKTSNNTLPVGLLLNHDDFFEQREAYVDPHAKEVDFLLSFHQSSFKQWQFEIKNDFNICLYGYGSKRALMDTFAEYLYTSSSPSPIIVAINGYTATLTLADMLTTIASTLLPSHVKLPSIPAILLTLILETLESKPPKTPIHILVNSIDAAPLRRPATQFALATLAAQPHIHMVATADTPNFPLLWDVSLRSRFRFLFHDCTTFAPFAAEIDPVECVNELLGRSGRRLGGRDGIGYVLRSLPENARHLFRILVAEQIAGGFDDGDDLQHDDLAAKTTRPGSTSTLGVEYRVLYHKAREELVCSTEHQLRTLLKEFYDHQMVESRRDGLGTERLVVPFRQEELESLLEDLVEEG